MRDAFEIKSCGQGEPLPLTIEVDAPGSNSFEYSIYLRCPRVGILLTRSSNRFDALIRYRLLFESLGLQICCQGARREAWASRYAKENGGASTIYITKLGKRGSSEDHSRIFGHADCSECVTVVEQVAFHRVWLQSVFGEDCFTDSSKITFQMARADSRLESTGLIFRLADVQEEGLFGQVPCLGNWEIHPDRFTVGDYQSISSTD